MHQDITALQVLKNPINILALMEHIHHLQIFIKYLSALFALQDSTVYKVLLLQLAYVVQDTIVHKVQQMLHHSHVLVERINQIQEQDQKENA